MYAIYVIYVCIENVFYCVCVSNKYTMYVHISYTCNIIVYTQYACNLCVHVNTMFAVCYGCGKCNIKYMCVYNMHVKYVCIPSVCNVYYIDILKIGDFGEEQMDNDYKPHKK